MQSRRYYYDSVWIVSVLFSASLIVGIIEFIAGCASLPAQVKDGAVYKFDLEAEANGLRFQGTGVLPPSTNYNLKLTSTTSVDVFTISTCHREFVVTDAIQIGWLTPKKSFTINFSPIAGIEDRGSCLIRLGAYRKSGGQNAWGLLDIEDSTATLPAQLNCNGDSLASHGVSICQARAGLIERISFPVEVQLAHGAIKPECQISEPQDKRVWEFQVPKSECVFAFRELTSLIPGHPEMRRVHRLTTVGYTDIKIRGDQ